MVVSQAVKGERGDKTHDRPGDTLRGLRHGVLLLQRSVRELVEAARQPEDTALG